MMGQHSALGKRMSVETNHNKAITKCLASAVHYQQVSALLSCPRG